MSWRRLEALLGRDRGDLLRIGRRAGRHYRAFVLVDRRGKERRIETPRRELKLLQRRILDRILQPLPLPRTMLGGVAGRSIRDNARPHVGRPCVVRIDLADCFHRISHRHVYRVFREAAGAAPSIAALLTRLTTRSRALPQGAPTSTMLANLSLVDLHEELAALLARRGLRFTQWVDDLVWSGPNAGAAIGAAIAVVRRHGHGVRCRKVRRMGAGVAQTVTGVRVNRKPSAGRPRIEELRRRLLELAAVPEPDARALRSLHGSIAQVAGISRAQGGKLARLAFRLGLGATPREPGSP